MNRSIYGLFLLTLCALSSVAKAEPSCQDFLQTFGGKPAAIEFLQCTQVMDEQGKPFVASYRLKGADALKVEQYMKQHFGMPPLKFYCCAWDSLFYFYHDKKTGTHYGLGMASEETLTNKRALWSDIKYFYISVSMYTEDP